MKGARQFFKYWLFGTLLTIFTIAVLVIAIAMISIPVLAFVSSDWGWLIASLLFDGIVVGILLWSVPIEPYP